MLRVITTILVLSLYMSTTHVSAGGPFDWFGRDQFDTLNDQFESVTGANCKSKSKEQLTMPKGKTIINLKTCLDIMKTSTTPSCSGPISTQKIRGYSVPGVVFSHTVTKMDFHDSHSFSSEKNTLN